MHIVWLVTLISYQFEGQISNVADEDGKKKLNWLSDRTYFSFNCYIFNHQFFFFSFVLLLVVLHNEEYIHFFQIHTCSRCLTIIIHMRSKYANDFLFASHIKSLETLDTLVSCYLLKAYPCCLPNTCREGKKRTSSASWEEWRTYMTVYMCWSSAMFGQQIDFACGNTSMGAKCIFAASSSLHFPWNFSPSLSECEKKWARKNNNKKKVITYLIIFSLGMLLHLLFLIGFADLSPINNDNNHQRQSQQLANTIANQPISILGRYDLSIHNRWSLLKMRSIPSLTRRIITYRLHNVRLVHVQGNNKMLVQSRKKELLKGFLPNQ